MSAKKILKKNTVPNSVSLVVPQADPELSESAKRLLRQAQAIVVYLGQELVADTPRGPAVAIVIRIDKTPQDDGPYDYKYLERKVAPL